MCVANGENGEAVLDCRCCFEAPNVQIIPDRIHSAGWTDLNSGWSNWTCGIIDKQQHSVGKSFFAVIERFFDRHSTVLERQILRVHLSNFLYSFSGSQSYIPLSVF